MSPSHTQRGSRRVTVLVVLALCVAACSSDSGVRATTAVSEPIDSAATIDAGDAGTVVPPIQPSDSLADGVGDALFPTLGNPGVDVTHYDIDLRYTPALDRLEGSVGLDVTFTRSRTEFTLDAVDLDVRSVRIDGAAVDFRVEGPELRITPITPVSAGSTAAVAVEYTARTGSRPSPIGFDVGWAETPAGSYVLNEPDGARYWLPCNDHPSDKATYRITLHVPQGVSAVASGEPVSHRSGPGGDTWVWSEDEPMATYLLQVLTGDYEVVTSPPASGVPMVSAVWRSDRSRLQQYLDITTEQMAFFDNLFGPFPLARYGLAITDSPSGFAMETQGRSMFSRDDLLATAPGPEQHLFLAHELAHQWFGDAVSPARWTDVWLNESFATYAEWLWLDHAAFTPLEQSAADALRSRGPGSTGNPRVDELFGTNVYDGGAVVLHALRATVGDDAFFRILREWVARYDGTSRSTTEFISLAEAVSGRRLTGFFDDWLFSPTPPRAYPTADTL